MSRSREQQSVSGTTASESLVLVKENRFAHVALDRLIRAGGTDPLWLVFLYGPSGVGKSHFVRHFLREAHRHAPRLRVENHTTSDFVARYSQASTQAKEADFQSQYSALDLLVLEDLASIQGRADAQRLLVVILDELKRGGSRVLVTCSSLPGELKHVLPRLASRLRGGLCVPIEPLDEASRMSFARHLSASRQIALSAEAVELLAKQGPPTPREILSVLAHLDLGSRRNGHQSDTSIVRAHLQSNRSNGPRSLPQIAKVVAGFYEVPIADLRSTKRQKRSLVPRQVAMLLARELSGRPAAEIAAFFGRKNHTTVVYACQRTRALLATDPALARDVEKLRRALRRLM